MSGDFISREAAISKIRDEGVLGGDYDAYEREEDVVNTLNSIPAADVVEVVRCADCVHYNDKMEMYCDVVCTIRHYCDSSPIIVGKDDFCSSGKRKDGGPEEAPAGTYDLLYEEGGPDTR